MQIRIRILVILLGNKSRIFERKIYFMKVTGHISYQLDYHWITDPDPDPDPALFFSGI